MGWMDEQKKKAAAARTEALGLLKKGDHKTLMDTFYRLDDRGDTGSEAAAYEAVIEEHSDRINRSR